MRLPPADPARRDLSLSVQEIPLSFQHVPSVRVLGRADTAWSPGDRGPLWRVSYGVLRLDRPAQADADARSLVQLVLPGDLVGLEALCVEPYRLGASALTPAQLEPVETGSVQERESWLQAAVMQLQRRSLDMTALRTGPVPQRVAQLLRLLGHENHLGLLGSTAQADAIRATLPRLRELAEVVDAKPETVCRALARLLPSRGGQRGPVATLARWQAAPLSGMPGLALVANA
jgi:CRP-like cAMP-binding protein